MNNQLSPSKALEYLSFLLFPLSSLYLSIRYFRKPESKNIFWFFCSFLGMIHIFNPIEYTGADGLRYAYQLLELYHQPVTWNNFISSFYNDGNFVDIYQPLLTYVVSLFTYDPHWLFFIFSVVFGFFYSRNLWFILEKLPKRKAFVLLILVVYFALLCPIWEINAARMWTALHVFVYGCFPFIYNGDKSKLGWSVCSVFFHFSFITPLIILLIYRLIPKSLMFYLGIYIITLFINEIDLQQIRYFLSFLPDIFLPRINAYTTVETASSLSRLASIHVIISNNIAKWGIAVLLVTICIYGKKVILNHSHLYNFMCFTLLLFSIANVLSLIPSGGRFITLARTFALPSIIFFIVTINDKMINKVIGYTIKYITPLMILPILFSLRIGCNYYGVSILFNPIVCLFVEDNQPFIQYIKSVL